MSLEKKSIHIRIPPELHDQLSIMADFNDKDIAELAARWLCKAIVAEAHDFNVTLDKFNRLGLSGIKRD
jgi:hypothetical protein